MSFNNVLPWWFYEAEHEHFLASSSCCFPQEYCSGTVKVLPEHVIMLSKATFGSWTDGGWNAYKAEKQKKYFRSLQRMGKVVL